MNNKNTLSEIKSKFPMIVLIILVLFLGLVVVNNLVKKKASESIDNLLSQPLETQVNTPLSFPNTNLDQDNFNIPNELMVYSVYLEKIDPNLLYQTFDLINNSKSDGNRESSVKFLEDSAEKEWYLYTDHSFSGDVDSARFNKINLNDAFIIAQDLVTKKIGIKNYVMDTKNIRYYDKFDPHTELTTIERGNTTAIDFYPEGLNYQLFNNGEKFPPITVFVDSSPKIVSLRIYKQIPQLTPEKLEKTINHAGLLNRINSGSITPITTTTKAATNYVPSQTSKTNLEVLGAEYHITPSKDKAYPYLHVRSNFLNHPKNLLLAEFLVLAIN